MEFIRDLTLEKYILGLQWEGLPAPVRERAVVCSIDLMCALLIGSRGRQCDVGAKLAGLTGQQGTIPVPGRKESYSLLGAVMVLGHASNSFDIDDGHNSIKGHPGAGLVAGVLAAALDKSVSYREYLTALVAAYEVSIRCGLATQEHYGFLHSSGTYGAFGTAAGICRLLGFSPEQTNTALSIADFHAPLTPVMRAVEYPSMNKDGIPLGAIIGAMAVLESMAGSTGVGYTLELPEFRSMVDSLGDKYEIMNLYFKPYTCCRWAHQPILACTKLMREHGAGHQDIEAVTVHTFIAASRLSKIQPKDTDQAQYNIAWPVAAAIVHGDLGFAQVRDEALDDPDVLSMMQRLSFVVDPSLEALFPEQRLARVEIKLRDGSILSSPVTAAPGEASENIGVEWITEKFKRITSPILTGEAQAAILDTLTNRMDAPIGEIISSINAAQGI